MRALPLLLLLVLALASACGPSSEVEVGALPAADPVLAEARLLHARHSPDGTRVAGYVPAVGHEGHHLVVAGNDGSGEARLGGGEFVILNCSAAAWSPDGRTLAVVERALDDLARPKELVLHAADGSASMALAPVESGLVESAPAWSPDGAWVGVASVDTGLARASLWRVDGAAAIEFEFGDLRHGWAALGFSPDGRRLALLARHTLCVFDLPEAGQEVATEPAVRVDLGTWASESVRAPAFFDDGRRVLCAAGDGLWVVDLERRAVERLLPEREVIDAVVMPGGAGILAVVEERIEPNAVVGAVETLATVGHPRNRFARTAWRVALDGSAPQRLPGTRVVSERYSFEVELGLAPSVRQALSRWR